MPFKIEDNRGKAHRVYKTLYLSVEMKERLEQLAAEHNTSCNNIIVSMIEYCLAELEEGSSERAQS